MEFRREKTETGSDDQDDTDCSDVMLNDHLEEIELFFHAKLLVTKGSVS
jgi:hypothetical protein